MNILPCEIENGHARFRGHPVETVNTVHGHRGGQFQLGVRPEFVTLADHGIPAEIVRIADVGRHRIVEAVVGDQRINAILDEGRGVGVGGVGLVFAKEQTRIYVDGWLA
jgi:glycerol transport system ATP-binding protein